MRVGQENDAFCISTRISLTSRHQAKQKNTWKKNARSFDRNEPAGNVGSHDKKAIFVLFPLRYHELVNNNSKISQNPGLKSSKHLAALQDFGRHDDRKQQSSIRAY